MCYYESKWTAQSDFVGCNFGVKGLRNHERQEKMDHVRLAQRVGPLTRARLEVGCLVLLESGRCHQNCRFPFRQSVLQQDDDGDGDDGGGGVLC